MNNYNMYNDQQIIDSQDKIIGIALLEHILGNIYNPLLTYGDLARKAHFASGPRALATPLGNLSYFCECNGLPRISAVVINSESGVPGHGFFEGFYGNLSETKWFEKLNEEYANIKKAKNELRALLNWLKNN